MAPPPATAGVAAPTGTAVGARATAATPPPPTSFLFIYYFSYFLVFDLFTLKFVVYFNKKMPER
jgi:hypothetical protein